MPRRKVRRVSPIEGSAFSSPRHVSIPPSSQWFHGTNGETRPDPRNANKLYGGFMETNHGRGASQSSVYKVTSLGDGAGSFISAIEQFNTDGGPAKIIFEVAGLNYQVGPESGGAIEITGTGGLWIAGETAPGIFWQSGSQLKIRTSNVLISHIGVTVQPSTNNDSIQIDTVNASDLSSVISNVCLWHLDICQANDGSLDFNLGTGRDWVEDGFTTAGDWNTTGGSGQAKMDVFHCIIGQTHETHDLNVNVGRNHQDVMFARNFFHNGKQRNPQFQQGSQGVADCIAYNVGQNPIGFGTAVPSASSQTFWVRIENYSCETGDDQGGEGVTRFGWLDGDPDFDPAECKLYVGEMGQYDPDADAWDHGDGDTGFPNNNEDGMQSWSPSLVSIGGPGLQKYDVGSGSPPLSPSVQYSFPSNYSLLSMKTGMRNEIINNVGPRPKERSADTSSNPLTSYVIDRWQNKTLRRINSRFSNTGLENDGFGLVANSVTSTRVITVPANAGTLTARNYDVFEETIYSDYVPECENT